MFLVTITVVVALTFLLGTVNSTVFATSNEANAGDDGGNCREIGYSDGRNGDFDHGIYNDGCEDVYLDGFIDGCLDAGNTRDVCESATDT